MTEKLLKIIYGCRARGAAPPASRSRLLIGQCRSLSRSTRLGDGKPPLSSQGNDEAALTLQQLFFFFFIFFAQGSDRGLPHAHRLFHWVVFSLFYTPASFNPVIVLWKDLPRSQSLTSTRHVSPCCNSSWCKRLLLNLLHHVSTTTGSLMEKGFHNTETTHGSRRKHTCSPADGRVMILHTDMLLIVITACTKCGLIHRRK